MKKTTTILFACIIAVGAMSFDILNGDGSKTNRTGGHGESGCTCHSGTTATATVTATPSIAAGYLPNTAYTIHYTVAETGKLVFGIDFQALNGSNANTGTLTAGTGTQLITTAGLDNITHTMDGGLSNDSHTFDFTWVAPAAGAGDVTFWYSAVAADHAGNSGGDSRFAGSTVLTDVTGMAENSVSNFNFSVFPNPFSETAVLQITNGKRITNYELSIYNVFGQEVQGDVICNSEGFVIRRGNLLQGVYFLKIKDGKYSSVKKIIIE